MPSCRRVCLYFAVLSVIESHAYRRVHFAYISRWCLVTGKVCKLLNVYRINKHHMRNTHSCYFFGPNQVVITFAHLVVRCYNFMWLFPWLCGFKRYIMVIRNIIIEKLQIGITWRKIIKTWNSLKIRKIFKTLIFEKVRETKFKNLCLNNNQDISTTTCHTDMI